MRFFDHGPNIPPELIAAQEKGQVLFVCGAGVSKVVGLPLFRELVQHIYDALGEDWSLHAAEREIMRPDGRLAGQYDRVLRCLERRLAASHVGRHRHMHERIRLAVRTSLTPSGPIDLENHLAMLELSRDFDGEVRVLTTNFDTLFERAWHELRHLNIPSHAGTALPQPKTAACAGVLHLHGRIADATLGLNETDLVLTSAEFGDAYLRSGWASRYLYDMARVHTLVLVGYQADDPPIRYLLEALESDRERFPDLQKVYAFAASGAGDEELESALWRAKAVEPIVYTVAAYDHSGLYRSIREWRKYAEDPTAWRRDRLRPLLGNAPKVLTAEKIAQCADLLSHGDATQLLGELSPSAEWVPVLNARRVFNRPGASPGRWIATRIDDSKMIKACSALDVFDGESEWSVERATKQKSATLSAAQLAAWRLMLTAKRRRNEPALRENWFQTAASIKAGSVGFASRRTVSRLLRPRLVVGRVFRWGDEGEVSDGPEELSSLVQIDFQVEPHTSTEQILKAWPNALEPELSLFRSLDRALTDALEEAEDVGFLADWDGSDHDVPSVGKHQQNAHREGFYPIVRALADLAERIASHDSLRLRQHILDWARSRFRLHKRLALYAMANHAFAPCEIAEAISGLDDKLFWLSGAQVEIMRLLQRRWADLNEQDREAIEERVRRGVPRTLFAADAFESEEEWTLIHDSSIYRRLTRLQASGLQMTIQSTAALAEIAQRHPTWTPRADDRDDFHSWHESRSGPQGNAKLLEEIPDRDLVQEAMRLQRERRFEEGDVWRIFCSIAPERALRGLVSEAERGEWDSDAWQSLIWAASDKGDTEFQCDLASQLQKMENAPLQSILGSAISWLQKHHESLANAPAHGGPRFFHLWDRFADLAYSTDGPASSAEDVIDDPLSRSMNEPAGMLAAALVDRLSAGKPKPNDELPAEFQSRFSRAASAQGTPGFLARVYLVRVLHYLDYIAPDWTARFLLPALSWNSPEALAMWGSYSQAQIGTARLFNALKPAMLQAFERPEFADHEMEGLISKLLSVGLWHRRGTDADFSLTSEEIRRVLTVGPMSVLQNASWNLWRAMADAGEPESKIERWRRIVGPLFQAIWPLDRSRRSESVSSNLVHMALECEGGFPDAVNAILDVIIPYELHAVKYSLRLEAHHATLLERHPTAFLRLLNALVDPAAHPVPADLADVLDESVRAAPEVVSTPAYKRLFALRRLNSA